MSVICVIWIMKQIAAIFLILMLGVSLVSAQGRSTARAKRLEAERRLAELGYWTGRVDARFDAATKAALIAFQKWEGRPITAELTVDEIEAIRNSAPPKAREPGYGRVEV